MTFASGHIMHGGGGARRRLQTLLLLTSALPMVVAAVPAAVLAASVMNSVSVTVGAGSIEANTSNNTAVDTDTLSANLVATNDSVSGTFGTAGQANVLNVLTGDAIDGAPISAASATLTVAAGSSLPPQLTFDLATGEVGVKAGTPVGTYSFDYSICETANPANCKTATVSVEVVAPQIVTVADSIADVNGTAGANGLINVLANDTLGGVAVTPVDVVVSVLTPAVPASPRAPVPTLDPATGLVSVPPGTSAGTYTITYEICEILNPANCATGTVSVVVTAPPATSALSGTVYLDGNGNNALDSGETRLPGWIVQLLRDGQLVETSTTDARGEYEFTDLPSAAGYEVRFVNPENNVLYGKIDNLTLTGGITVVDQNQPIDPSGVIYDVITRDVVSGATVNLTDTSGNVLPAACYVDASQRGQVTGDSGYYRFDIVPGAAAQCPLGETEYRIAVTPPAGYSFISTVVLPQAGPLDPTGRGSPVLVTPSNAAPTEANPIYYLTFRLASGDPHVMNNHIPLDPFLTRTPLVVTKVSTRRSASTGDLVPYEITVRNTESAQRAGVDVIDVLPAGLKYVAGSATVAGVAQEPETQNGNRELVWHNQIIPANGLVTYTLTAVIGAGVTQGEVVNTGVAESGATGAAISNRGTAVVSIIPSSVFDCSELIGKVFEDTNRNGYQDEGEPGVPAARLATVNGQLVTTDEQGRYHIACAAVPDARIGSNYVLKLDTRSLPLGWQPTTDNPRSIRLTRGKMGELNFGVAPPDLQTPARPEGE